MGQKSRGQHLELVIWSLWHPTAPWGSLWEERRRGIKLAAMRDPQWQRHQGCPPRSPPQACWFRKARSAVTSYLTPQRPRQPQLVHATGPATSGGNDLRATICGGQTLAAWGKVGAGLPMQSLLP